MFYKSNFLLFFILFSLSCAKPKHSNEPYTLTASSSKYVRDGNGRSLLVNVVLTNNTKDTLKYWEWSCFQDAEYGVKSEALSGNEITVCTANFPIEREIAPHESKESVMKLFFKKSFKGGSLEYQMQLDLYVDPGNNKKIFMTNFQDEITPKSVQSNVVDMYIDPSDF